MKGLQDYGTASVFMFQDTVGGLPTRNFVSGTFAEAEALSGETMTDTILKHNDTCYACSVRCKRAVETEYKGTKVDPLYGGPEYETLSTLGSYCCVGDLHAVSLANQVCAQYGLDTISTSRRPSRSWTASARASSPWRTPAGSSCASGMPMRCWRSSIK